MVAELLIILVLILLNGLFAMAEMALVSARRARLQHAARGGDAAARRALALAEHPDRFLSTVQVGITLIGVLAGAYGGATVSQRLADGVSATSRGSPPRRGRGGRPVTVVVHHLPVADAGRAGAEAAGAGRPRRSPWPGRPDGAAVAHRRAAGVAAERLTELVLRLLPMRHGSEPLGHRRGGHAT